MCSALQRCVLDKRHHFASLHIDRALTAVRRNGNPELLLDAIAMRWPRA